MSSLNKNVFDGAVWSVGLRLFIKFLAIINTIVLARILSPEDFGLIAIVMSIYALLEAFKAFGFDVVLIQQQNANDDLYNTAWTLQIGFSITAAILLLIASPYLAAYFEDPRLTQIGQITSLMFLFSGAVNIGVVNFRKHFDFGAEFRFKATVKIISVALTIFLAIYYRNYWALVFGMLFSSILEFLLSYKMSSYRPKISLSQTKHIFSFSFWLMINNLLFFSHMRVKDLMVGKMLGIGYTGLIQLGDEITSLPSTELVAAVNRATFPGYSKISHDKKEIRELYLLALSAIAYLGLPACIGISLVSPLLVPVAFGDKWIEVIPVMQVLGFAYALISINTNAGYIFLALGKPKLITFLSLFKTIILITSLYIFIDSYGLVGAALSMLIVAIFMFPAHFILLKLEIGLSFKHYIGAMIRPLISSIVMYLATSYIIYGNIIGKLPIEKSPSLISLISAVILGCAVFFVFTMAIWIFSGRPEGLEARVLRTIKSKPPRR